jgi:hypothetical protein
MNAMQTVSSQNWNCAVCTGTNIPGARIEPFKGFAPNGKTRRPGCYGRLFPDSDSAWAFMREHGFTQDYHRRPDAFIDLRLSPATRRYLLGKTDSERWDILERIHGEWTNGNYMRSMRHASYMAERREKWSRYMAGEWSIFKHENT